LQWKLQVTLHPVEHVSGELNGLRPVATCCDKLAGNFLAGAPIKVKLELSPAPGPDRKISPMPTEGAAKRYFTSTRPAYADYKVSIS
jgi:hypothetical protein